MVVADASGIECMTPFGEMPPVIAVALNAEAKFSRSFRRKVFTIPSG
jgi:hypothetical protein